MLMLAAHHTQNSSKGLPCRSESGTTLIPLVSMLQARSLAGCSPVACTLIGTSLIGRPVVNPNNAPAEPDDPELNYWFHFYEMCRSKIASDWYGRSCSLTYWVMPTSSYSECLSGPIPAGIPGNSTVAYRTQYEWTSCEAMARLDVLF